MSGKSLRRLALAVLCVAAFDFSKSYGVTQNFTTLQPGQFRQINQSLQINIVFVGYHQGSGPRDINEGAFLAGLPNSYNSVNRIPEYYGLPSPTGLGFTYNYNLVYANSAFENAFFTYLGSISEAAPLGFDQQLYNQQNHRSLDITGNCTIEAALPEKWLADHSQSIGVDTGEYTVFFVNWYGRPDFRFHYYRNTSSPDPDTGHNFGAGPGAELRGWGGTTPDDAETGLGSLHRIWYFDLSAGPTELDWNIDDADFVGWGQMQYRMPPIWEYGNVNAYRSFNDISGDLGLITRFVAINELFTTSPLYKVALSPPKLPTDIELDMTLYQADPEIDGRTMVNQDFILRKLSPLRSTNRFTTELSTGPLTGPAEDAYRCITGSGPCKSNRFGSPFANMFLYFTDHQNQFLEGDGGYEIPIYLFTSADSIYGPGGCSCSYSDDNWVDGTQSIVVAQLQAFWRHRGYGLTSTIIHEVGHHLGMSHPHDGYDSSLREDYDGQSRFYAYYGEDSSTAMMNANYEFDFSQFDRDNMNRNLVSAYINQADVILGKILASPRANKVSSDLSSADHLASVALNEYQSMEYANSVVLAKTAYERILSAASAIDVPVEPQAAPADRRALGKNSLFRDSTDSWRRFGLR
jgi:hypothetical protein